MRKFMRVHPADKSPLYAKGSLGNIQFWGNQLDDAVDGKHGSLDIDICVSKLKFLVDEHISTNNINYKDNI